MSELNFQLLDPVPVGSVVLPDLFDMFETGSYHVIASYQANGIFDGSLENSGGQAIFHVSSFGNSSKSIIETIATGAF